MIGSNIRGCGILFEESGVADSYGMRRATDLLRRTVIAFAKRNVAFHDKLGWYPFADRERQLHSLLLPAFADIAEIVYAEQSINRRIGKRKQSFGFLDYWIVHRDVGFIVEVKKASGAIRQEKIVKKSTQQIWGEAVDQADAVNFEEIRNVHSSLGKIFRVSLLVLPLYKGSSNKESLTPMDTTTILPSLDSAMNGLDPTPNWAALWWLSLSSQEPVYYNDGKWFESYPAVLFLARISSRR